VSARRILRRASRRLSGAYQRLECNTNLRCHAIEPPSREFGEEAMLTPRLSQSAIGSSLPCETGAMSLNHTKFSLRNSYLGNLKGGKGKVFQLASARKMRLRVAFSGPNSMQFSLGG
jgi:hypothetical protein